MPTRRNGRLAGDERGRVTAGLRQKCLADATGAIESVLVHTGRDDKWAVKGRFPPPPGDPKARLPPRRRAQYRRGGDGRDHDILRENDVRAVAVGCRSRVRRRKQHDCLRSRGRETPDTGRPCGGRCAQRRPEQAGDQPGYDGHVERPAVLHGAGGRRQPRPRACRAGWAVPVTRIVAARKCHCASPEVGIRSPLMATMSSMVYVRTRLAVNTGAL